MYLVDFLVFRGEFLGDCVEERVRFPTSFFKTEDIGDTVTESRQFVVQDFDCHGVLLFHRLLLLFKVTEFCCCRAQFLLYLM
jgi:hypothetical protein